MRQDSSHQRYEFFLVSAAIAAHATNSEQGFRQRDFKFLIEMFSNWLDFFLPRRVLELENIQIKRYLEWLVRNHYATVRKPKKIPRYRLSQTGMISLLGRLSHQEPQFPFEFFLYRYHILKTYREPIYNLIEQEGAGFPKTLKAELERLFDLKYLVNEMKRFVDFETKRLEIRIKDNEEVIRLVRKGRKDGLSTEKIIKMIEEKHPYELNSQKSLSDFYDDIPTVIREYILEKAIDQRRKDLWLPSLETLHTYQKILNELLAENSI